MSGKLRLAIEAEGVPLPLLIEVAARAVLGTVAEPGAGFTVLHVRAEDATCAVFCVSAITPANDGVARNN